MTFCDVQSVMFGRTHHHPWTQVFAALVLLLGAPSLTAGTEFVLARDGRAVTPVVIAPGASNKIRALARELSAYLGRMTGGAFEVVTNNGSSGIVLGRLEDFPDAALSAPLEIRRGIDGRESFVIRTESYRVRLIGATDLGASHAVFRLLEQLGCRRFFPAKEWEVIPSKPTLAVSLNESDRPAIWSRRIWYGYGSFDSTAQDAYAGWARHNRMASSRQIHCGHAWQDIISANKKTFDAHSEYLALVKGKRQEPQLCVSQPAVRQIAVEWALSKLRKQPGVEMISMETADGDGHCECDGCRKLGSVSERAFGLANEVARAVSREFPGKMIGMYAYNDHCEPPSFTLETNVYVQSTAGFIRGRYTFEELMTLWPKVCKDMGFYEYFSVWLWDFDMPPGGNGGNIRHITDRVRRYAQLGATSIDCESGANWGLHGRGYYVANRLMWNPSTDVDALLADFYEKAFGPAAAVMRRYYERLDPGNEPLVSAHTLGLALRDLEEATRLASGRPDVLSRLEHLKQYQHYVRLRWEYTRAPDATSRSNLTVAALTHVYRTRYSFMNHWQAMWQEWDNTRAKELGLAQLIKQMPWRDAPALSAAETERYFQSDLEFFKPEPVTERAFSDRLVPWLGQTNSPGYARMTARQQFQRAGRYALFSRGGEALECTVSTGLIAWYRDRPQAAYRLEDGEGRRIGEGRLPQDGAEHALRIEVPKAGVYWLSFDDQAAGWGISAPASQALSLALVRSASYPQSMGHLPRLHFLVPKGSTSFTYYWDGGPHEILGPDGAVVRKVESRGQHVTIPVAASQDGRVWAIDKLATGHLWFLDVPNYLAPSPETLLVPRELLPVER